MKKQGTSKLIKIKVGLVGSFKIHIIYIYLKEQLLPGVNDCNLIVPWGAFFRTNIVIRYVSKRGGSLWYIDLPYSYPISKVTDTEIIPGANNLTIE